MDSLLDGCYLLHHLLIHSQTAGSIDYDYIITVRARAVDGFLRLLYGVGFGWLVIHFYAYLLAQHAQLLDGSGTIHIAGHQHHLFAFLNFQEIGQFGSKRGLTGTLQTR